MRAPSAHLLPPLALGKRRHCGLTYRLHSRWNAMFVMPKGSLNRMPGQTLAKIVSRVALRLDAVDEKVGSSPKAMNQSRLAFTVPECPLQVALPAASFSHPFPSRGR